MKDDAPPRPYEMLPTLVNRVAERIVGIGNTEFKHLGITVRGARVLLALLDVDALRVSELVERCAIEPSTFSHLLGRLVQQDYVTRSRPEKDNRAVIVTLTASGRSAAEECRTLIKRHHGYLIQSLDANEAEQLRQLLNKVLLALKSETPAN